ncbi:class I SAM-dependent methyltransferase [bacterium]|nr:class I SAM-dependent methyltransferase [bacterium]
MEKQIYQALANAGSRYWWNQGRQYLVTQLFKKYSRAKTNFEAPLRILDIGCAAGGTLFYLSQWGEIWGLDISSEAIALCEFRGIPQERLVLGNAESMMQFEEQSFDLVTAVEILEHLEHPEKALREILRVLKPGGTLIITVPADMKLWSERDERLGHRHRYTVADLIASVAQADFEVLKASYANVFYYWPFRFLLRLRRNRSGKAPKVKTNTLDMNSLVNWFFVQLLKIETWIILRGQWQRGVSAICIARKKA